MKESVLSFEKTTQPLFTYFQIAGKYLKSFKTNLLKSFLTISVYDYLRNKTSNAVINHGYEFGGV